MLPPTTERGRRTRGALLDATAELVAERGFHAVGIADIGAAAGVSGSAIYRHFRTKDDLLVAVFERVVDGLLIGARTHVAGDAEPWAVLDVLVRAHVAFALEHSTVIKVYDQEAHNLPADQRRRVRRQQRAYAELWTTAIGAARPDLSPAAAAAAAHAAFGLINSVADYERRRAPADVGELLRTMALAALGAR